MNYINIVEYGLVIRRGCLFDVGLTVDEVSKLLEFPSPLDSNDDIVSYGPCFGGEAADEFCRRLTNIGLQYVDDFFVFNGDFPFWCTFKVGFIK